MLVANIVQNIFVRNIVRNNLRPVRNICSELDMGQTPNRSKIDKNLPTSPKVNMLKFGDVSFDLGFERGKMSATGYVAKISMLRLNIGSGKLSSCMLRIGLGPKCEQGKGGQPGPDHADLGYISCCCVERHHSKPKSKLTSPNFNMLTFADFA